MNEITRSTQAMFMAAVAAAIWALGDLLGGLAYTIFAGPQDYGTYVDLGTASEWLHFAAAVIVLSATALVTWSLFVARKWPQMWEVGGTTLSTLLLAIGFLVIATSSTHTSTAGNVVIAIGVGGWAIVVLVGAARHALAEQDSQDVPHQAILRLMGAGSLIVIAVSVGLPTPELSDATLAIATQVVFAVGFLGLTIAMMTARSQGLIRGKSFSAVAWGLWLLVLAGVAGAVTAGIVYGPPPISLTAFRAALPIPAFIEAVAILALGWAALNRVAELRADFVSSETPPSVEPSGPETANTAPPSWQSDPTRRNQLRWWDGTKWTEHVLNGNQSSVDPLPRPGE